MGQFQDRVQETTAVTGTGPATLLGAVANYIAFGTAFPNASTPNIPYAIIDNVNNAYEVGWTTYTLSSDSISRDYVTSSSNGGALVNFAAGTKIVFVDALANSFNWPMMKESLDVGETMVIPANYVLIRAGNFTENGGNAYVYGDRYYI